MKAVSFQVTPYLFRGALGVDEDDSARGIDALKEPDQQPGFLVL